jgi:hypothetical protein
VKKIKTIYRLLGLVTLFILLTSSLASADVVQKSDDWKNFIAVYAWLPAITGNLKTKGVESNLDVTYSDSFNALKYFWTGHYEGFKGHFGVLVDWSYVKLEKDSSKSGGLFPGNRQMKVDQALVELALPYRLMWHPVVTDLFVGGRYNGMKVDISLPDYGKTASDDKQWVDVFVGGRVLIPLNKSWYLGLRGDIGGFGVGNSSDLALNGSATINWQITPLVSAHLGYRAYYLKYNQGDNEWNATQHGPWLGVGFSF